jgi:hypothetical protein
MTSSTFKIDDTEVPRMMVHEAGHAAVAAASSSNSVGITIGADYTDEGEKADAICTTQWKRGESETTYELYQRRIATLYGSAFAEAILEAEDTFKERALELWTSDERFKGDALKLGAIRDEARAEGHLSASELAAINADAWAIAQDTVRTHRKGISELAKVLHSKRALSDEEIRAVLSQHKEEKEVA